MAAELHPPAEAHIAAASIASAAAAACTTAVETAVAPVITTAANSAVLLPAQPESTGPPPPALKRQRRPSVRLGEIGDQAAALSYDSHQPHQQPRRVKHQPCRLPKEPSSSKSVKARSLTNLVNGNDGVEGQEVEGNQNGEVGIEFGQRRKAKRWPAKRPRSSWASKVESLEEKVIREDKEEEGEEEVFRDFDPDPDSDSQLKGQESPLRSFDNRTAAFDTWGRRTGEFGTGGSGEGVRSWLFELGLSRYAPVFEVHEVDDEVLPWLTLEDLKDMGINAVGSRRKLYSAIQKLRKGYS